MQGIEADASREDDEYNENNPDSFSASLQYYDILTSIMNQAFHLNKMCNDKQVSKSQLSATVQSTCDKII